MLERDRLFGLDGDASKVALDHGPDGSSRGLVINQKITEFDNEFCYGKMHLGRVFCKR